MPAKKIKTDITKVAVIGAGVMGAGIAAQVANAGVEVVLLDIVPKDLDKGADRNVIANTAVQKLLKSNPAAFMHKRNAKLITTGNTEDSLELLKDCDWIVEAVIERIDIKQALYKKVNKYRKKTAVVSSNTSTIPLDVLTKGMAKGFTENFMITHFFNPPRYMRLLELVTGDATKPEAIERIRDFSDRVLGKSVVDCYDRPGFIANRIGTFWIHAAVTDAVANKVGVEEADAVLSRPIGVPKTGVFGLVDLVGLDLMPHVLNSLTDALPKKDDFHKLGEPPAFMEKMIEEGYTGRKGKGGFYRLNVDRKKEVRSLQNSKYTLALRPKVDAVKASKKGGLRALVTHPSKEGQYARRVMFKTLAYAAQLVGDIAENLEQIDRAMRLGYNWKMGPMELIDKMGPAWFAKELAKDGISIPKILTVAGDRKLYTVKDGVLQYLDLDGTYKPVERPEGVLLLQDVKRKSKPILSNKSASLWDVGDGVACLEFHSKMNSLNPNILSLISQTAKELPKRGFKGLVLHNEGSNYSVGANIVMLLLAANFRLYPFVTWILKKGQNSLNELKYAPFPVVGAPSGMALGGGCETLLHCDAITAHAESYIGLVEVGVGIIPGWGGCKELLLRGAEHPKAPKGPMPPVAHAFQTIATAQVSKSAEEAKGLYYLRPDDDIVMNRDRVLATAKAKVLELAKGYAAPEPKELGLPGPTAVAALTMAVEDFAKKGIATPHDVRIAKKLAYTLSGGDTDHTQTVTEEELLRLERVSFLQLVKTKGTRDRIMHMIKKGKPLRN